MRRVVTTLIALVAFGALAGTTAAMHLPTTGTPIRLLDPAATPATFPSDTPFFVRHGWVCAPEDREDCLDPTSKFRLYVDGELVQSALDLHLDIACPPPLPSSDGCSSRGYLTNFRLGLPPGSHVFRGEWWFEGQATIVRVATIEFVG